MEEGEVEDLLGEVDEADDLLEEGEAEGDSEVEAEGGKQHHS